MNKEQLLEQQIKLIPILKAQIEELEKTKIEEHWDITRDIIVRQERLLEVCEIAKMFNYPMKECDWRAIKPYGCYEAMTCHPKEILNVGINEYGWLLNISFSTGCYTFGDYYDSEFFNEFFEELKKDSIYCDDLNHSIYYLPSKTSAVMERYHDKFTEYKEKYKELAKRKKKEKLLMELELLD